MFGSSASEHTEWYLQGESRETPAKRTDPSPLINRCVKNHNNDNNSKRDNKNNKHDNNSITKII